MGAPMKINFTLKENASFPVPMSCPECGENATVPLGQLRADPRFTCSCCGKVIEVDLSQLDAALDAIKGLGS